MNKQQNKIENLIKTMVEERVNERVAAELHRIANSYFPPKPLRKTTPRTKIAATTNQTGQAKETRRQLSHPRGTIKSVVLSVLTAHPMTGRKLFERVRGRHPGITPHQVTRSLTQLTQSKACVRTGKHGKFKYTKTT